jgi:hypothetical protein
MGSHAIAHARHTGPTRVFAAVSQPTRPHSLDKLPAVLQSMQTSADRILHDTSLSSSAAHTPSKCGPHARLHMSEDALILPDLRHGCEHKRQLLAGRATSPRQTRLSWGTPAMMALPTPLPSSA